jgi:parvulin-like peptidyl-prolyl isomerase
MSRPAFFILFLAFTLAAAEGCRQDAADPVILRLSDQSIRRSEFEQHVATLSRRGHEVDAELRQALLQPFLEERVLVLEARAHGLVAPGASLEAERAAVEALLARALPKPEVTDAEVKNHYDEHLQDFRLGESVTLRQILVPTQNEARDVRRRLQRDPRSFEMLARSRSRAPEASTGGLMGTFEPGQLPSELETPAFALTVGATSEIVSSPLGYHVLRADARTVAREQSFEESAPRIRALLLREKTDVSVRTFIGQLLARAKVDHESALSSNRPS